MSRRKGKKSHRRRKFAPKWQSARESKIAFAKELREKPTATEAALWARLEHHAELFLFQHVICGYIADFYSPEWGLVVEVDGSIHDAPLQAFNDRRRDSAMRAQGYEVLRITAALVSSSIEAACRLVDEAILVQKRRFLSVRSGWRRPA